MLRSRPRTILPRLSAFVAIALVAWLYLWWVGQKYPQWVMAGPSGYNGEYAQALLRGHLYLKDAAQMAQLADPYDPAQYTPYYSFDLSYYDGHIYSYFGVVPALVLFLPWRLLAGNYPTDQFAAGFFMAVGFALSLGLLAAIRRRYLPNASTCALALAATVLAVGNLSLLLFWPPYYCQVVQGCARCLQLAALGGAFLALQPGCHSRRWLALASLAAGLMVATRPSFLPSAFLLIPVWLLLNQRARARENPARRLALPLLVALAVPIGVVGLAQMAFNFARFDSPLEFGTTYQQFGQDLRDIVQFSPAYMPKHILQHLFFIPKFLRYFPFMVYQEPPLGALVMLPFSWCAALLPLGWRTASAVDRPALRALAFALLIAAAGNLVMLSGYYLALVRHQVDVVMPLTLAAAVGLLAGAHAWHAHAWKRRALLAAATLLATINLAVTFGFACSYPHQSELPVLTRILNAPVYLWEKLCGKKFSDTLRLELTFASAPSDTRETLLRLGHDKTDIVFVHYLDNARATLGFFHADLGAIESEDFPLQAGTSHVVELTLGSLSPPAGHPVFATWPSASVAHTQRRLLVRLDGRAVLAQDVLFHPAGADDRAIGEATPAMNYAKFSGHIASVTPLPLIQPQPRPVNWPTSGVTFDALFSNRRIGRSEPLVVSGTRTAGDVLWVTYLDNAHVQLVLDHGTTGETQSPPLALSSDNRPHRITLRPELTAARTVVLFDDVVVLTLPALPFPASPETVYFGIQTFPAHCEPVFSGRIDAIAPLPTR